MDSLDCNPTTCQMLLDRGCPLDVADSSGGDTVLHLATRAGDNALLAVLLRKGANPDIANKVISRSKRDTVVYALCCSIECN